MRHPLTFGLAFSLALGAAPGVALAKTPAPAPNAPPAAASEPADATPAPTAVLKPANVAPAVQTPQPEDANAKLKLTPAPNTKPSPTSTPQPKAAATPLAPAKPSAAAPLSPSAASAPVVAAPLSGVAAVSGTAATDEPMVPEEVSDPMAVASQAPLADLRPLSTTTLAKLAAALGPDMEAVSLDTESGDVVQTGGARVDAGALYAELARRLAREEDKDARAALALAVIKDPRAKEAKDLAFEAKLADSVIAQLEAGDKKAKEQLEALAKKGNARARGYLHLDGPPPSLEAAAALSGTAATVPAPAQVPAPAVPAPANAPVPVNPAAVSPAAKP